MSYVTNVMLSIGPAEVHRLPILITEINKWLDEHNHGAFEEINAGGYKGFEADVFAAAFNFFNTEEFLAYLKTLHWEEIESVQVFVNKQDEPKFTLYELGSYSTQ
jgi:hypothetical protein